MRPRDIILKLLPAAVLAAVAAACVNALAELALAGNASAASED